MYTTIKKPSDYMTASIWTGNGTKITTGFSPDLIWFKARNAVSYAGILNAISGYDKYTQSFSTDAETTSTGMMVTDSTGYTPGSVLSSNSYVGWSWKANGAGSANTDGTINSTVSANTTSGFSIVSYTGNGTNNATVGHGLGVTPTLLIGKCLGTTANWQVVGNFGSLTEGKYLTLNETSAIGTSVNVSFDASATTVKFQGGQGINISGQPHIAYCFAEKKGFSKFGSYIGNNSNDGPFIYTGFKPAFVMIKNAHDATNWSITDNKRAGFNVDNDIIYANTSGAEDGSYQPIDHLSNGFKIRLNTEGYNGDGGDYIYMAFAEEPLVGDNPATAR